MINFKDQIKLFTINNEKKIGDAIEKINENKMKTVFVINAKNKKYIGSITDGDIRRGIIKNYSKNNSVMKIVNKKSIYFSKKPNNKILEKSFIQKFIQCVPLLDKNKKIKEIFISEDYRFNQSLENTVVILAGGKGKRLRPLTKKIPKPMLKINNKPIILHLLNKFKSQGFRRFIFCIKYKSSIIKKYFKDGKKFGVNISYKSENKYLGTGGPILNVKKFINKSLPFIVCNGDIYTEVDFLEMMNFHNENKADITILCKFFEDQNKYGVIKNNGILMKNLEEKPKKFQLINCGAYIISPKLFRYFGKIKTIKMTEIIQLAKNKNKKIIVYPAHEFWIDIGTQKDYQKSKKLINYYN